MNLFMGLLTDPFIDGPGDGAAYGGAAPSAYASTQRSGAARDAYAMFTKAPVIPFEQRWSVWAAGFGGSQTTDGNAGAGIEYRDQQHRRYCRRRRLSLLAEHARRLRTG